MRADLLLAVIVVVICSVVEARQVDVGNAEQKRLDAIMARAVEQDTLCHKWMTSTAYVKPVVLNCGDWPLDPDSLDDGVETDIDPFADQKEIYTA